MKVAIRPNQLGIAKSTDGVVLHVFHPNWIFFTEEVVAKEGVKKGLCTIVKDKRTDFTKAGWWK